MMAISKLTSSSEIRFFFVKPRHNTYAIKRVTGYISQEKKTNVTQCCHRFCVLQLGLRDAKGILGSQNTSFSSPSTLTLMDE